MERTDEREAMLERVEKACELLSGARNILEGLFDCGLPDGVAGEVGELKAEEYRSSLDDALFNVKVADNQFDRCYAILSGERDR